MKIPRKRKKIPKKEFKLKAANETRVKDQAQCEALNEELENVVKTVITSTARYGSEQGDAIDAAYRTDHIICFAMM